MNIIFKLFLIMTPALYTLLLSILPFFTGELEYLFILLNYFVFGKVSNSLEKKFFKSIQGDNSKIGLRPNPLGTKFGNKYDKCSIPINLLKPWKIKLVDKNYFKKGKHHPTWGFPSGHAQETSFIATILTLYFINKQKTNKNIYILILWILNVLVIYQRVEAGCHTLLQVIIGNIFGIILGIISYYQVCNRFFPEQFPISISDKFFKLIT
tara:strand:- start:820 stop:1449 length:630 start_codon:yes stop_codon:yes gene_type:complete